MIGAAFAVIAADVVVVVSIDGGGIAAGAVVDVVVVTEGGGNAVGGVVGVVISIEAGGIINAAVAAGIAADRVRTKTEVAQPQTNFFTSTILFMAR